LSPEYIPGNDFISRLLLEDQRVMDIIIKSLIGEHASSSLYCLGRCEWLNKSVSDVLYVPKTENLAPILIEVQHDVNEDFISRAISYCLSVKKDYGQSPILLIIAIKAVTDCHVLTCQ
jgi:hypothetical protein